MSDIAVLLNGADDPPDVTATEEWAAFATAMADRGAPQAVEAILPTELAGSFRDAYARLALCEAGTGTDGCAGCRAWTAEGHPDLLIAGKWGHTPGIAECLALQAEMHLRPVAAKGRVGVVPEAQNLQLPAANALLKIAEEPPGGGGLLFLTDRDNLIPTIRSRVWVVRFRERMPEVAPRPLPRDGREWAAWLETTKKASPEEMAREIAAWTAWLGARGEWRRAAALDTLVLLAGRKHMPVSMVQDAAYAILGEGVRIEQIFDDLRET